MGDVISEEELGSSYYEDDILEEYKEREGVSPLVAALHIICITAGVGVLNLPRMVADSGWLSTLFFPLITGISVYTASQIVECLYMIPENMRYDEDGVERKRLSGFPEIGEAAFGKPGLCAFHIFHKFMIFGICIVFLILAGTYLQKLFHGILFFEIWQWIGITVCVMLVPLVFIKNMDDVIWTSAVGFISTVFLIVFASIICVKDILNFSNTNFNPEHRLIEWGNVPVSLAGMSFAFCGNFVYPKIEESMRSPQQFKGVVKCSMVFIMIMYLLISVLAYSAYGNKVMSPVLCNFPSDGWLLCLTALLLAHVLAAIPLPLMSFYAEVRKKLFKRHHRRVETPRESIASAGGTPIPDSNPKRERRISIRRQRRKMFDRILELSIRILVFVLIGTIACVFCGSFAEIMNFFGAVTNSAFLCIFPPIFYIKLKGRKNMGISELLFSPCIVLLGLFTAIVGGYKSFVDLIGSL